MAKDGSGRCGQTFLGASQFSRTVYKIVHQEYSSSKLYVSGIEPGVLADAMKVLRIAVRGIFTKEMYSDLAYLSPLEAIQLMCEAEPDRARLTDRLHAAEQEPPAPRRPPDLSRRAGGRAGLGWAGGRRRTWRVTVILL